MSDEVRRTVRAYWLAESLGLNPDDFCMLPDCCCDGAPHDM